MAYSYAESLASGSTAVFTVPFDYISRDYVHASVGGSTVVDNGTLTWNSDTEVVLPSTPAAGTVVRIYRSTPKTPLVVFQSGDLSADDLNLFRTQCLHVVQEALDASNDVASDLASLLSSVSTYALNAASSATAAGVSASSATTSAATAATYAAVATAQAQAAQTWNPTTYYTKVQCDAQYFPLDGSGVVQGIIYAQSGARLGYSRLAGTNTWSNIELYQPEAAGSGYGVSLMGKFRGVAKVSIDAKDNADGSAYWRFLVTPAGADAGDRRSIAGYINPDGTLAWSNNVSTTGSFVGDGSQLSNVGMVQSVSAVYSASTALTAVIPSDSTIPQVTEGTQILSVTITPKQTTSKLRVRFSGSCAVSAACRATAALFVNGAANAVNAVSTYLVATGNGPLAMEYEFSPGSTSAQTIAVRVGPESGNLYMNNAGNTSYYTLGGIMKSMLVVEEVK